MKQSLHRGVDGLGLLWELQKLRHLQASVQPCPLIAAPALESLVGNQTVLQALTWNAHATFPALTSLKVQGGSRLPVPAIAMSTWQALSQLELECDRGSTDLLVRFLLHWLPRLERLRVLNFGTDDSHAAEADI
jgi:hypothetical protein